MRRRAGKKKWKTDRSAAEDPELFADRVKFAFESLRRAQSRARLNFFIDNMPIDDIQCLDVDQVSRILDLAKNSTQLRVAAIEPAANDLVREANLDFARTMNKIIFLHQPAVSGEQDQDSAKDAVMLNGQQPSSAGGGWSMFSNVSVDELEDEDENPFGKPVPWYALWPVPEYNFTQKFAAFCFASLYIKPEVVSTLCAVAEECLGLLAQCVYATKFQKALRLDQFKQLEKSTITQMSNKVKESWVVSLQKIILKNFENVGKGWFSIHESNPDTYRQGKMKKMLAVIRFMMQDTMRYFALDSIAQFCEGIEAYCPEAVEVIGLHGVTSTFGPSPSGGEAAMAAPRLLHQAAVSVGEVRGAQQRLGGGGAEGAEVGREPCEGLFSVELRASE
ncbi:unnamed protein product, partial [Prorocentrum cordatum]